MGLTDLAVAELQEILRGKSYDVALFTTAPLADGSGGVECSAPSYLRVAFAGSDFTAPDATRTIANSVDIEFPQHLESWGDIKAVGCYEGSDLVLIGALSPSKFVAVGQGPLKLAPGDLSFSLGL